MDRVCSIIEPEKRGEFPQVMGPFSLVRARELTEPHGRPTSRPLIELDLSEGEYRIELSSSQHLKPQLDCLATMYREKLLGSCLRGKISSPCAIRSESGPLQRRREMIPEGATHFVWAYRQTRDWPRLTPTAWR